MGSKIGCTCETGVGAEMGPQRPTNVQNKGPRTSYSTVLVKAPPASGEKWPGLSNRGGRKEAIHETNKH